MDAGGPVRTCVACRQRRPQRELLRVIRTPQGVVVTEHARRADGRGAYVCALDACIALAERKGGLQRALRAEIPSPCWTQLRDYARAATEKQT